MNKFRQEIEEILNLISSELEVPENKYRQAEEHYSAVGKWLNHENSALAVFEPVIYPQGSFALGTVVKPTKNGDCEYDLDAVCELQMTINQTTPAAMKQMVGNRLKAHETYKKMLQPEGRRCWTLNYSDGSRFHLDILPAIPDPMRKPPFQHAILISDKTTSHLNTWHPSDPRGYVEWFKGRMRTALELGRKAVALQKSTEIHSVPDYAVVTPLQKAIQLLKRHRDLHFDDDQNKPISIIITTLAAKAYNNENSVAETLINIIPRMKSLIEIRGNEYWVANPVNENENFADKWKHEPVKAHVFFNWLQSLDALHKLLVNHSGYEEFETLLVEHFGETEVLFALRTFSKKRMTLLSKASIFANSFPILNQPHRERPLWRIAASEDVSIVGHVKDNREWIRINNNDAPLSQGRELLFKANTTAMPPYSVFWQVTNTGDRLNLEEKRGKIFPATTRGIGGLTQKEGTAYPGTHWIECFVVKNDICVARSGEFLINIS